MSLQHVQALPIDYILDQKYQIFKILGSGAFSVTYLAKHKHFGTEHVIKEYLPDSAIRGSHNTIIPKTQSEVNIFEWGLDRFYEEAKLLNQLNHPNIVKVTDLFEDKGTAYFVMPYLGRHTLKDWINENPNPSVEQLNDIFIPLLEGLKYIHEKGLLHRDIKPENIIVSENDTPILIDFGSARHAIGGKSKLLDRVLTPPYAPIEQYSSATQFTESLDLYSLSACMYQAITHSMIPEAPDRLDDDPFVPLASNDLINTKYPIAMLKTIDKNLSLKSKDRHQSANEMQNGLLGSTIIPSEPVPQPEKKLETERKLESKPSADFEIKKQSERTPVINKVVIGIFALLLLLGLTFLVINLNKPESDSNSESESAVVNSPNEKVTPIAELTSSNDSKLDAAFNVQGSNTIGSELMPQLLVKYYEQKGNTSKGLVDIGLDDKKFIFKDNSGNDFAIDLGSHGSSTGMKALLNNKAQLAMSSRKIKPEEVEKMKNAGMGDMESEAQEIVIGLDGIAVIVNKNNTIDTLTTSQLNQIFTGKITNWSELGGEDQKINLYIRDEKSGTRDTFDSLVLNKEKGAQAKAFEDSEQLSDSVSNDIGGIGYIGLPYIKNAKALAIAASSDTKAFMPTSFTISTEDYPLSRRLYLYLPKQASEDARGLANFTLSKAGQKIVHSIGFIDITPDLVKIENITCDSDSNLGYKTLCNNGKRLDANFRFAFGSSNLDNKAKQALRMVTERLNESKRAERDVKFVLVGFADNKGADCINNSISLQRANIVAKELEKYGVEIDHVQGMGSEAPVGDNSTEAGREKNRRVELWTVPSDTVINFPKKNTC